MYIVTQRHLQEAIAKYPDTENDLKAWSTLVKSARWHTFLEVRKSINTADNVDGYVIFNIRGNRYRLVTVIHYAKTTPEKQTEGHVYIRSFLTHEEYDDPTNWDRRFGNEHSTS